MEKKGRKKGTVKDPNRKKGEKGWEKRQLWTTLLHTLGSLVPFFASLFCPFSIESLQQPPEATRWLIRHAVTGGWGCCDGSMYDVAQPHLCFFITSTNIPLHYAWFNARKKGETSWRCSCWASPFLHSGLRSVIKQILDSRMTFSMVNDCKKVHATATWQPPDRHSHSLPHAWSATGWLPVAPANSLIM
jgi:hypothetical protein